MQRGRPALVVGCLGFFLCLAVRTAREAGDGAGAASARTTLHASVLVFLAALLRLDDLLKNAPRPECRAGGALTRGGESAAAGSPPGYSGW